MTHRYGDDVLAGNWRRPKKIRQVEVELSGELVLEDPDSGFVGAAVRIEQGGVELEDRFGKRRSFRLEDTFLLDGEPVTLRPPRKSAPTRAASRTASGSLAVADAKTQVARASRIYVEGRHDAELVERVWGDDLRIEGVLVDHLVRGSKEARIADQVQGEHVLVVGHPYVDIWQAVKPTALGIAQWPDVPKGQSWKHGVLAALGWPAATPADLAAGWKRILSRVDSYADLEPDLLGRVEELIDFVTAPGR